MVDLSQAYNTDHLIGEFKAKSGSTILVIIKIPGAGSLPRIGGHSYEQSDIFFSNDPVEIKTEVDDFFDVIFTRSCKISLYTKKYLGDLLFTSDSRNITVNVWELGTDNYQKCLFAGFVEPNIYNQPYNHMYDSLNLNCTCPLCTLQHYPYRNLQTQEQYDTFKSNADKVSFETVVSNILGRLPQLNLLADTPNRVFYDGSVRTSSTAHSTSIFTDCNIFDLLWLGETKDDLMDEQSVLEEILKYFDLHCICIGTSIYIFCAETLKKRGGLAGVIDWYPLVITEGYYVSQSKMIMSSGNAREMLIDVNDSDNTIPGNLLETDYDDAISYLNGKYINYEYAVLPDQTIAYTGNWRYADLSYWTFLNVTDDKVYILVQDSDGNYVVAELKEAPEQCFDPSTGEFIYTYYVVDDDEYIVVDDENTED